MSNSSELLFQDFSSPQIVNIPSSAHYFSSQFHWEERSNSELSLSYHQYKISWPTGIDSHVSAFLPPVGHWSAGTCQRHVPPRAPSPLLTRLSPTVLPFLSFVINFYVSTKPFPSACKWIWVPSVYKQKQSKKVNWPNFSALLPSKNSWVIYTCELCSNY